MRAYTLTHLSDHELLRDLAALFAQDHATTAALLAHLAEVDRRRLYLPAGYPSLYTYCVIELRLSEGQLLKRIQAARAARKFPVLFDAVADGRLHLTAVCLLAPHLNRENAAGLIAAAAHKTRAEIERLLAQRFPGTELLALVQPIPGSGASQDCRPAPAQVGSEGVGQVGAVTDEHTPAYVEIAASRSEVKPHASERFALHLTIGRAMYDDLQYAQALLSHALPSGDVVEVLRRALRSYVATLEKRKFAATGRPRSPQLRSGAHPRSIPAHVKRAVWERDRGQCAFVGAAGHRCPARRLLETLWNDGLAIVRSCHLREERPTAVGMKPPSIAG